MIRNFKSALFILSAAFILLGINNTALAGRLEIADEYKRGGGGGESILIGIGIVVILVAVLQAYLWSALGKKEVQRAKPQEPVRRGTEVRRKTEFIQVPKSKDRGTAQLPAFQVKAEPEVQFVRCSRCYGKYNPRADKECPYCAEERMRTNEELKKAREATASVTAQTVSVSAPEPIVTPAQRYQEAEYFNEEGIRLLKNIASVFRVDDAIKKFTEAIRKAPRNASYYNNRGVAHFTNAKRRYSAVGNLEDSIFKRDIKMALEDFTRAIELMTDQPNYFIWRAQLYEFTGTLDLAKSDFEYALKLDQKNQAAKEALERIKREFEAQAPSQGRQAAERLVYQAEGLTSIGDMEGALRCFDEAISADPANISAYFKKADLLNMMNRVDESMTVFGKAVEVSASDLQGLLASYKKKGIELKVFQRISEEAEAGGKVTVEEVSPASRAEGPTSQQVRKGKITGSLSEMALPDILQVLAAGQKTVEIEIFHDGSKGSVILREGQIVDASTGEEKGEDAFYHLLTWLDGDFTITPVFEIESQTIFVHNDALILEGLRRMDEAGKDQWGEG